jgi:hypothetical protein
MMLKCLGWTWKGQAHTTPRWVIIIKKNLYLIRIQCFEMRIYSFKRSTGAVALNLFGLLKIKPILAPLSNRFVIIDKKILNLSLMWPSVIESWWVIYKFTRLFWIAFHNGNAKLGVYFKYFYSGWGDPTFIIDNDNRVYKIKVNMFPIIVKNF